jgi:hypothetical protein
LYGKDGKKLSNKERKRLNKEREAAKREAEYEKSAAKASREGAQFACSQTAFNENDPQWQNSLDINIPSFGISAAGKVLFQDAELTIGHGRRYGLGEFFASVATKRVPLAGVVHGVVLHHAVSLCRLLCRCLVSNISSFFIAVFSN